MQGGGGFGLSDDACGGVCGARRFWGGRGGGLPQGREHTAYSSAGVFVARHVRGACVYCLYVCPHTEYICVLILTIYACVLILSIWVYPHTDYIYVSSYPHTVYIYVSSY
jgi:hypothetical protein